MDSAFFAEIFVKIFVQCENAENVGNVFQEKRTSKERSNKTRAAANVHAFHASENWCFPNHFLYFYLGVSENLKL